jgi:1-acyl-sn-glycerol-3-phosphate acyltransferase
MPNRKLYRRARTVVGWACRRLYRVEVEGGERMPERGGALLAANHDSSLDPALLALASERPIRFLARAELWLPGLRRLLDALGGIPVRRGRGDRSALRRAVRALESGELVAIFPQGTTLGFRKREYQGGAARLALATGAPLVPVRLVGTAGAFRVFPPRLGFPKLRVVVGEPIPVERQRPTRDVVAELTRRLELEIVSLGP